MPFLTISLSANREPLPKTILHYCRDFFQITNKYPAHFYTDTSSLPAVLSLISFLVKKMVETEFAFEPRNIKMYVF